MGAVLAFQVADVRRVGGARDFIAQLCPAPGRRSFTSAAASSSGSASESSLSTSKRSSPNRTFWPRAASARPAARRGLSFWLAVLAFFFAVDGRCPARTDAAFQSSGAGLERYVCPRCRRSLVLLQRANNAIFELELELDVLDGFFTARSKGWAAFAWRQRLPRGGDGLASPSCSMRGSYAAGFR